MAAAKKYDFDVSQTLELIRSFWPDFPISKENFERPTSDFVVRFFKNVVPEFNEKLSFIINEEVNGARCMETQGLDEEIYVYCQMSKIYKKLNYSAFTLSDIYDPHPKRTHALVKTAIHFLIFINNNLDNITNASSAIYKKFTDTRDLTSLKQQTLRDAAENSENVALSSDINKELKTKLEAIKTTKYEQMLRDKAERERIYGEKSTEKKHLESEVDNLDYELHHLQQKESDLQQRLFTEEDFQNLEDREKYFELELERISREDCDVNGYVSKQSELCEYLAGCAKDLEALNFDSLDVYALRELREKLKVYRDIQQKYQNEKSMLDDAVAAKTDSLRKKKLREEETRNLYSQFHARLVEEAEKEYKLCEEKTAEFSARFQESQRLQTEIGRLREDVAIIEGDRRMFMEKATEYHRAILAADHRTNEKFRQILEQLNTLK